MGCSLSKMEAQSQRRDDSLPAPAGACSAATPRPFLGRFFPVVEEVRQTPLSQTDEVPIARREKPRGNTALIVSASATVMLTDNIPRDTKVDLVHGSAITVRDDNTQIHEYYQLELKIKGHNVAQTYTVNKSHFERIEANSQTKQIRFVMNPTAKNYRWWESTSFGIKSIVITDDHRMTFREKLSKAMETKAKLAKYLPEASRLPELITGRRRALYEIDEPSPCDNEPSFSMGAAGHRMLATPAAALGSTAIPPMSVASLSAGLLLAVGALLFVRCLWKRRRPRNSIAVCDENENSL